MNFDFNSRYKDYTTIELLKITMRPANYQPDAVAAAKEILQQRNVTTEDTDEVSQYYHDLDNGIKAAKNKAVVRALDFMPATTPQGTKEMNAEKWVKVLLAAVAVQFVIQLFFSGILDLHNFHWGESYAYYLHYLDILLLPTLLYFLYKRNPWGWYLAVASYLIAFLSVSVMSGIGLYFSSETSIARPISIISKVPTLLRIAVDVMFVVILLQDKVTNYFSISESAKVKTVQIAAAIAVVLLAFT